MSVNSHVSQMMEGHLKEAVKTYSTYDGSDRLEFFYVANIDIADGELCMSTQYTYDATSTRIVKTKESKATWQAAWEI